MYPYPTVFRLLAVPGLLLIPLVLWVVRPPSHDGGGTWNLARGQSSGEGFAQAVRTVATSRVAALLALAVIPIFYVSACIAQHTVLLLRDQGLSLQAAAAGVGTMFVFGLLGKIGSGFVLLRMPLARTWTLFLALMFVGSLALWLYPRVAHGPAIARIGLGWVAASRSRSCGSRRASRDRTSLACSASSSCSRPAAQPQAPGSPG